LEYKLSDIAKAIQGTLSNPVNPVINHLLIDSRNLLSPGDSLFFALKGDRHDGHNFISELAGNGVLNFVVNYIPQPNDELSNCNFIVVKDTLKALQTLCSLHRKKFNIPVIGITGSNGKTIVKEWLFQLLNQKYNITRSPKSYNSQVGVPLSVWLMDEKTEMGIFEAGISRDDEMQNLQNIISPTIGIFTNIGEAHQENFISQKQKAKEKLRLFSKCEALIYNRDYLIIDTIVTSDLAQKIKTFTWSQKFPADLNISNIEKKEASTKIAAKYKRKTTQIAIPFTDDASIENAIHCWATLLYLGFKEEEIQLKMEGLSPVAMRLELKAGIHNCTLINDYYNSDIQSLNIALDFLNHQKQHDKRTIILSDILQSGMDEKKLYSAVANLLLKKNVHRLIGIGPAISHQAGLFKIKKKFFSGTEEFLEHISEIVFSDEAILLKGARAFRFEEISKFLQQKTHDTVLEINLNAVVHNLNYFKSLLKPETKVMAMVKAFSYGSGLFEIANVLQYQKVDYLAVAYVDEGIELRRAGITIPVMVMDPEMNNFELMLENRLEPEIYSFRLLEAFLSVLQKNGIRNYPVHIKLDTGMRRLGFESAEIEKLISFLLSQNCMMVKSVFSHLAASDETVHDDFTLSQFLVFEEMSKKITDALKYPVLRHILNSSGIERFPEVNYDMVRLGIGLYGISSINQNKLEQISSLKCIISQIKNVSAKETVGYSRKGQVRKNSVIATVPIGYADGLDRRLGNGVGYVLVKGEKAPIIGNICMDMCMIDITGINAKEGDEIIVFGKGISVSELAEKTGTIPYEILTGISRRVKRVYYHE